MDYNSTLEMGSVDRRKVMESYFPEFLRGNKDFRVFIKLAAEEMGLVTDYIELFTSLTNADEVPEKFLADLGEMVGYSFIDNTDPEIQRELIKRIFNKHQSRGDEKSLIMMAQHAPNQGYLGGDLFIPGTYMTSQEAVLTFPRDLLYTWSRSKRSGFDRYPDGQITMDGVIEVVVGYYDENVKNRTETVKPAGVRLYFKLMIAMTGDTCELKIPLPKIFTNVELGVMKYVSAHKISQEEANSYSGRSRYIKRSGNVRQQLNVDLIMNIAATSQHLQGSLRPLYYPDISYQEIILNQLAIPVQIIRYFLGTPTYSGSYKWNHRYARSGHKTGLLEVPHVYARVPEVKNTFIPTEEMDNVYTSGTNNYTQSEFEIQITRRSV